MYRSPLYYASIEAVVALLNCVLMIVCRNISGISSSVDIAFRNTLKGMPEPRSIGETVRAWDASVRRAVTEFARQLGGELRRSSLRSMPVLLY